MRAVNTVIGSSAPVRLVSPAAVMMAAMRILTPIQWCRRSPQGLCAARVIPVARVIAAAGVVIQAPSTAGMGLPAMVRAIRVASVPSQLAAVVMWVVTRVARSQRGSAGLMGVFRVPWLCLIALCAGEAGLPRRPR